MGVRDVRVVNLRTCIIEHRPCYYVVELYAIATGPPMGPLKGALFGLYLFGVFRASFLFYGSIEMAGGPPRKSAAGPEWAKTGDFL